MLALGRLSRAVCGLALSCAVIGALCSGSCHYAFSSHNHHDDDHAGSTPLGNEGGGPGALFDLDPKDLRIARFDVVLADVPDRPEARAIVGIEGVGLPGNLPADDFLLAAFGQAVIRANEALLGVRGKDRIVPGGARRDALGFELRFELERRGETFGVLLLGFDRRGSLRSIANSIKRVDS